MGEVYVSCKRRGFLWGSVVLRLGWRSENGVGRIRYISKSHAFGSTNAMAQAAQKVHWKPNDFQILKAEITTATENNNNTGSLKAGWRAINRMSLSNCVVVLDSKI